MKRTPIQASKPDEVSRMFSTNDIARIFPVSLRQLQWWDERKVVSPVMEGHSRRYSTNEVIQIGIIVRLRDCGMSLQAIRRLLRSLQGLLRNSILPSYLLISGKQIKSYSNGDEPQALSDACRLKDVRLIALEDITERIREARQNQRIA